MMLRIASASVLGIVPRGLKCPHGFLGIDPRLAVCNVSYLIHYTMAPIPLCFI